MLWLSVHTQEGRPGLVSSEPSIHPRQQVGHSGKQVMALLTTCIMHRLSNTELQQNTLPREGLNTIHSSSEVLETNSWEFSGSSVVRTWCFHCRGLDSVPGWGTKVLQAVWYG